MYKANVFSAGCNAFGLRVEISENRDVNNGQFWQKLQVCSAFEGFHHYPSICLSNNFINGLSSCPLITNGPIL